MESMLAEAKAGKLLTALFTLFLRKNYQAERRETCY